MKKPIIHIAKDAEGNLNVTLFGKAYVLKKRLVVPTAVLCACVIVLLATVVVAVVFRSDNDTNTNTAITNTNSKKNKNKNTNKVEAPTTAARRLDGMPVAIADANKVPECVMIENAAFGGVRPQSGLSQASVVYEVIVEGGITRFMAVFAGEHSDRVGPVRSARDTYLEFAAELNCSYFHAGGSDTALAALYNKRMRHVDGLIESKYFWRDNGFLSPHNLFTSTNNLDDATTAHNWTREDAPSYTSWTFQAAIDSTKRLDPATEDGVNKINIGFGGSYDVEYNYNTEQNYFERKNGGVLQTDAVNGQTISAKNVIVQHVGPGIYIEGKGRVNWPVTGEGNVDIFHDGQVYRGTWKKADRTSRTLFFDASGNPIPMLQGNSWVEIVPDSIPFSYQ
jgi:hypothetical protein